MNRSDVARARALVAELSALLDALEGSLPREEGPRKRAITPAEAPVRKAVEDSVRRNLRRRWVVE